MNRRDWERWFPEDRGTKPQRPTVRRKSSSRFVVVIGGAIAFFILAGICRGIYTELLWYDDLGYSSVYASILITRLTIFLIAATVFAGLLLGNIWLAKRLIASEETTRRSATSVASRLSGLWLATAGAALGVFIFGMLAQVNWPLFLRFFNAQPFGLNDPIFNKDIGFYVFTLPFLEFLHSWLLAALIITALTTAVFYFLRRALWSRRFRPTPPELKHLAGLVAAVMALFAWGYWLSIWKIVLDSGGLIFGAGYADVNAHLPARWIMLMVVVGVMAVVVLALLKGRYRWALYGLGVWAIAAVLVGILFPIAVQRLQVQPNELELERPYIGYNIEFTRAAFGLNRIAEQAFPAEEAPSASDLTDNRMTIDNIRLWDPRPLKDTYNQIQAIRLYYDFNDVDIDRYQIKGEYRQVMLSARELSVEKLDAKAQTWVNRHLQFTHGYGIAMSPVNEITKEGLPVLWVKDIPPSGVFDITRPEIYFGEKTNHYVIVGAAAPEFDYPMGEENVYGRWQGTGGVSLGGFINRLAYAWEFGDLNILISGELTGESRLLYRRNIVERVRHLAPFLEYDRDPYLVVLEGRLLWIQDAYTTTDHYPYSTPYRGGLNYIRNSVKAVVDAYDGRVTFYISEPDDPLIKTYQAIFPDLFTTMEEMPAGLRSHLRYPEDYFLVQASLYQSYHMRDIRVFYNKEDLWAVPREVYAGVEQAVAPYYVIMRLPGEAKEEFLLMLPFTPVNKNNAIGWLAARCDGDRYGTLLAYLFPKERLVYGPSQIENRIQQNTTITEQLALWSRGGSRVIRGNLLLIPLARSKLYVEPVFLQSESGGLPELKRVIVAIGERIAMAPTLREAITVVMGEVVLPVTPPSAPPPVSSLPPGAAGKEIAELITRAQEHYDKAQRALRAGDWTGYGQELAALKKVLDQLVQAAAS